MKERKQRRTTVVRRTDTIINSIAKFLWESGCHKDKYVAMMIIIMAFTLTRIRGSFVSRVLRRGFTGSSSTAAAAVESLRFEIEE
jgi:hypothetical protein